MGLLPRGPIGHGGGYLQVRAALAGRKRSIWVSASADRCGSHGTWTTARQRPARCYSTLPTSTRSSSSTALTTATAWRTSSRLPPFSFSGGTCPVSLDLARRHVADLRRARFAETASSWLSH